MDLIKTHGLVIKSNNFGEANRLLTIITPAYGKILAVSYGSRSLKSKSKIASVFNYCEFVLKRDNKTKGLYHVQQAALEKSFHKITNSLSGFYLATYVTQVLNESCFENMDCGDILNLALNCFFVLCETEFSPKTVKLVFDIRLFYLLGVAPDVSNCTSCGEATYGGYLYQEDGVFYCGQCHESENNFASENKFAAENNLPSDKKAAFIGKDGCALINYITTCPPGKIFSFKISDELADELYEIISDYVGYHVSNKVGDILNDIL